MTDLQKTSSNFQGIICPLCNNEKSVIFCKECHQGMCNKCKTKHDKIKNFHLHATAALCSKHAQAVTHICAKCVSPVCIRCMMFEHSGHEETFEDFQESVLRLTEEHKYFSFKLKKQAENAKEALDDANEIQAEIQSYKSKLLSIKDEYLQELTRLDNCFNEVDEEYEQDTKNVLHDLEQAAQSLHELSDFSKMPDIHFLKEYSQKIAELKTVEKVAHHVKDNPDCLTRAVSMCSVADTAFSFSGNPSPLKRAVSMHTLRVAEAKFSLQPEVGEQVDPLLTPMRVRAKPIISTMAKEIDVNHPSDMAISGDGRIFISDSHQNHVVCLNKDGKVIRKYQPLYKKIEITSISVFSEKLYIAQSSTISMQAIHDTEQHVSVELLQGISSIWQIRVINESTIFIMTKKPAVSSGGLINQYKSRGAIYAYTPHDNNCRILVHELNNPVHLSISGKDDVFAAVTSKSNRNYQVQLYDSNWQEVFTIRGAWLIKRPIGTLFPLGGNILLVADRDANRISCFTSEGQLLRDLLTADEHGILYPCLLVYKAPCLWVLEYFYNHPLVLKCFELKLKAATR